MRLFIVRHGETIENIDRIIQGQNYGKLSELGREQSRCLGMRLKDEEFDIIYSSDLKRVTDTAEEIAKHHSATPLVFDERIRERSYGELEGQVFPDDWDWNDIPACVEQNASFDARVKDFYDEVFRRHSDETVLVVSHGCIKKKMLSLVSPVLAEKIDRTGNVKNTSVTIVDVYDNGCYRLHALNCTKHLECKHDGYGK